MAELNINFSAIKFVSNNSSAEKVDLNAIFDAVIKANPLNIDESNLRHIIQHDLAVNITSVDERLIKVLVECLIYYMTTWPGWQQRKEYDNKELQYKDWFEQFRMYLVQKSGFVMQDSLNQLPTIPKKRVTKSTQSDEKIVVGKVAPYTIFVGGPPAVLNKVVFIENKGDVLVKQHLGTLWWSLSQIQIFNWPHVSVEVQLPNFSFTRTVTHSYDRYIGIKGDSMVFPEVSRIKHISKIEPNGDLQPYSYIFLQCYVFQLIKLLEKVPAFSRGRLLELRLILTQFLKDVEEMNIYNRTIATNSCVGFHIGGARYIRNKKMVSTTRDRFSMRHAINFYEIMYPQIDLSFIHFDDKQNSVTLSEQNSVNFVKLDDLMLQCSIDSTSEVIESLKTFLNEKSLIYNCTLCKLRFVGVSAYNQLTAHFKCSHTAEQSLLCCKCGKQFDFGELAAKRWAHECGK